MGCSWCLAKMGVALACLAALVVVAPLIVPVPPLREAVPPQELADADSRFVDVGDLTVHHKRAGGGQPAIVLMHGFGASVFSWREVLDTLGQVGSVAAYDRPGFGLTERPLPGGWTPDASPYAPQAQVELLFGLLDELGVERAVLVGHSAGGTLATLAALQRPERVVGLVLVAPAILTGGGAPPALRPLLHTPQMRRVGPLVARALARQSRGLLERAYHDPAGITPDVLDGYQRPFRAENWDVALWEFTVAAEYPDLSGRLSKVHLPTMLITGDDDRVVPTADTLRVAQMLPDAHLVVLPDCGHLPHEERPEEFLDAVLPFLEHLAAR